MRCERKVDIPDSDGAPLWELDPANPTAYRLSTVRLNSLPRLLIWFRLACAPALVAIAASRSEQSGAICTILLSLGVLSDIFDGVIARRIGVVTDGLRTFDSRVDLVFWLAVTACVLILHPQLLPPTIPMIAVLGLMEGTTHLVSFLRFRREASPHHLLSKLFGLALWALLAQMLLVGSGGWLQIPVFILGIASQAEALAIMLLIPEWRPDVAGVREAMALRRARERNKHSHFP